MPRSALKSLYGIGYTASMCGLAVTRAALGDGESVPRLTRRWSEHLCAALGVRVLVEGAEQMDHDASYLVISNHQSLLDVAVLIEALPQQLGFLAKKELGRIPLFGKVVDLGGHVLVDRSTRSKAVEAIRAAADHMREGFTLVIFPEGTRGDGARVGPFKMGAFHLAKLADAPILPVGIEGTAKVLGKHQRRIRPGTVQVRVGEPLSVELVRKTPVVQLSQLVRAEVARLAGLPLGTTVSPPGA